MNMKTKVMKFETATYFILKVLGYAVGLLGAYGVLGVVGSLECDRITFGQFWLYEFFAACLIGLSILIYILREAVKEDYQTRARWQKRKEARAKK